MLLTIIVFILILGLLIFVHELGHFLLAKKLGMKVEEFGFGFPPRIFGIKKGETIYSLNLIPIGGFVKILGEDNEKKGKKDPKSFSSKPIWQRAVVLSSGVLMNFILAIIILSIGFSLGLPQILDPDLVESNVNIWNKRIMITYVAKDSPANKLGFQIGDQIISIDGRKFIELDEFSQEIESKAGSKINLEIKKGDQTLQKEIIPRKYPPKEQGAMGVELAQVGTVAYPWYKAVVEGTRATWYTIEAIFVGLYKLVKTLVGPTEVALEIAGPVGIAALTGRVIEEGWIYVLQFIALLSINLGIINILPFPALDGGRLVFLGVEKIRGKKVNPKIENWTNQIGMMLLIALMIFITFRDVMRFKGSIINVFQRIGGYF